MPALLIWCSFGTNEYINDVVFDVTYLSVSSETINSALSNVEGLYEGC